MEIRKFVTSSEEILAESGRETGRVVRKAVCSAVIANPLAGRHGADLAAGGVEDSFGLGNPPHSVKQQDSKKH